MPTYMDHAANEASAPLALALALAFVFAAGAAGEVSWEYLHLSPSLHCPVWKAIQKPRFMQSSRVNADKASGSTAGLLVLALSASLVAAAATLATALAAFAAAETVAVAAVITNPWSGKFIEDLKPEIHAYAPILGEELSKRILKLANGPDNIEAYGKPAVVGTEGEIEHGSAFTHTLRFGLGPAN